MRIEELKRLAIGDKVHAFNGIYVQNSVVTKIEPHDRGGKWITFEWTNPKGVKCAGRKRHTAVECGWNDVTRRRF